MLWLKQSTIVIFQLGPFVDVGDAVTPETGLATAMDNATTGIRVSKNGAVGIDRNSATVPAHDNDGYYRVTLSATDTNTLGTLHVQYEEFATCLPAWKDFMVVPANIWDTFFGADQLDVNVTNIIDTAPSLTGGDLDVNIKTLDAAALTAIEDEIWDALKSAHVVANSFGDFLDIEVSGRLASADIGLTGGAVDTVTAVTNDVGITQAGADKVFGASGAIIPELAQGIPAITPTPRTLGMLLYMALRNKLDVTSGFKEVHNDAGTLITKKVLTDDGATYSEAKMISGA